MGFNQSHSKNQSGLKLTINPYSLLQKQLTTITLLQLHTTKL